MAEAIAEDARGEVTEGKGWSSTTSVGSGSEGANMESKYETISGHDDFFARSSADTPWAFCAAGSTPSAMKSWMRSSCKATSLMPTPSHVCTAMWSGLLPSGSTSFST